MAASGISEDDEWEERVPPESHQFREAWDKLCQRPLPNRVISSVSGLDAGATYATSDARYAFHDFFTIALWTFLTLAAVLAKDEIARAITGEWKKNDENELNADARKLFEYFVSLYEDLEACRSFLLSNLAWYLSATGVSGTITADSDVFEESDEEEPQLRGPHKDETLTSPREVLVEMMEQT